VLRRITRRGGQLHRELDERGIDVHLAAFALQRGEFLRAAHRGYRVFGSGDALDDDEFLHLGRIADQDLHHEAVDLRLGQRIRALGLDRVLRRHHEERIGTLCDSPAIVTWRSCMTSSSALCTLAGARLISSASSRLVNTGPERGRELAGLLAVDARSHQVGGHEVRRELDPAEGAADRSRQGFHGKRLGEARHAFDQQVPLRQHRHHDALQEMVLADDDFLDLVEDFLHCCSG
jgi:hypothetical protein